MSGSSDTRALLALLLTAVLFVWGANALTAANGAVGFGPDDAWLRMATARDGLDGWPGSPLWVALLAGAFAILGPHPAVVLAIQALAVAAVAVLASRAGSLACVGVALCIVPLALLGMEHALFVALLLAFLQRPHPVLAGLLVLTRLEGAFLIAAVHLERDDRYRAAAWAVVGGAGLFVLEGIRPALPSWLVLAVLGLGIWRRDPVLTAVSVLTAALGPADAWWGSTGWLAILALVRVPTPALPVAFLIAVLGATNAAREVVPDARWQKRMLGQIADFAGQYDGRIGAYATGTLRWAGHDVVQLPSSESVDVVVVHAEAAWDVDPSYTPVEVWSDWLDPPRGRHAFVATGDPAPVRRALQDYALPVWLERVELGRWHARIVTTDGDATMRGGALFVDGPTRLSLRSERSGLLMLTFRGVVRHRKGMWVSDPVLPRRHVVGPVVLGERIDLRVDPGTVLYSVSVLDPMD